jgi:hypothetical protein
VGGKKLKVPEMAPEQQELQRMQLELLREQRSMQDLLAPYFFKRAGLQPRYEGGKIVGFDEALDPESQMRRNIERGLLERSQKALRGELDLDPALEREIAEGTRLQEEAMRQQLGPGWETSTPGIQARATANQRAAELRSAARRGELTLSEQLGLARGTANEAITGASLANIGGAAGLSSRLPLVGAVNQSFGPYMAERQLRMQTAAYNASQPSALSEILGLVGMVGGMAAGGYAAGPMGAQMGGQMGARQGQNVGRLIGGGGGGGGIGASVFGGMGSGYGGYGRDNPYYYYP